MTAQMFGVDDRGDKDVTLDMLDYKYIDECNNVKVGEILFLCPGGIARPYLSRSCSKQQKMKSVGAQKFLDALKVGNYIVSC